MKKSLFVFVLIVIVAATVCTLVACNRGKTPSEPDGEALQMFVPDGAPALSVAKIIKDGKIGESRVEAHISTGDDVVGKCSSGEADIAVLPTNAAAKICNMRNDYVLFSVNVYGTLYIVGTKQLTSFSQLKGERLYSIGLGNTPEFVLKTVCDAQGVEYLEYSGETTYYNAVMVKYFTDASEIIPLVLSGEANFALVGEPAASQLVGKLVESGKTGYNLFDMQQLWQTATESKQTGYPQASMIVKKSLLNEQFRVSLDDVLTQNAAFLKNNVAELGKILKDAGSSLTVNFNEQIIERCHIVYTPALSVRSDLDNYLKLFGLPSEMVPLKDSVFDVATDSAK